MIRFKLHHRSSVFLLSVSLAVLLIRCTGGNSALNLKNELDSIGALWVQDKREGIFDVSLYSERKKTVLKGETDSKDAKSAIVKLLNNRGMEFYDSLIVLPDSTTIKEQWGLVNVSVCNIRLKPSYSAELTSQALMGTPVRLLKKQNGWSMIQTPDAYIGWVDSDIIIQLSQIDYSTWKSSPRIIYMNKTGDIYGYPDKNKLVSDIVAGCILVTNGRYNNDYKVLLPDGRIGLIPPANAIPLDDLSPERLLRSQKLVTTAESFNGIPYLWGGTSVKGFDCSGFVKTVYYLSGIILARDASLQFNHGTVINKKVPVDSLIAGDLLFFGSVKDGKPKATHVAMYIGNTEYIHSSGMVKTNSLDSTRTNFSKYRKDTFIGIRRIIGTPYQKGIQPVNCHPWYK